MNQLQKFEAQQVAKVTEGKKMPEFKAGDTVKVNYRIVEGDKERIQAYQGVCISRKNAGVNSAFTVRKISDGEGVERVFPLFSPKIASVEVIRRGSVRRSKLYYLRDLSGKSARIKEKYTDFGLIAEKKDVDSLVVEATAEDIAEQAKAKAEKAAKAAAPKSDKKAKPKKTERTDKR
jgi:large subunit ribosomal protein L19